MIGANVNVFGVTLAAAGTAALVWGLFGSVRVAAAVAGLVLAALAAGFLLDVGGDE